MLELGVKILIAYLLGTLLGSLILGRLRGVDIRSMGSGNAGATNALRTQGKMFGILVLLVDIAKGFIAVRWLPAAALPSALLPGGIDPELPREWLTLACGFGVIIGHVYPVWFGFRGGKGAATMIGVAAALDPRLLVPVLLSWFVVLLLTGYVGLATMLAALVLVIAAQLLEPGNTPLLGFCILVAGFVIYTHRGNITRMWNGQENRARLWLFRSRAA
jgi:glycerol-3-phosphate acyltransferase PlsY